MENVTGTKGRQSTNDIALKTNGDQASCKKPDSADVIFGEAVTTATDNTESGPAQFQSVIVMMAISCPVFAHNFLETFLNIDLVLVRTTNRTKCSDFVTTVVEICLTFYRLFILLVDLSMFYNVLNSLG